MAILLCLACDSRESYELARWENMPLSALTLPHSEVEAQSMPRYVIDMKRCASCGHVFNSAFESKEVDYRGDSTLVFNQGQLWIQHQRDLAKYWIEKFSLGGKRIVEIGCGDGAFLELFLKEGCEVTGFEPGQDADTASGRKLPVVRKSFDVSELAKLKPDALICRHVIEHLGEPKPFLEAISRRCLELRIAPVFLAEVPRIEKALEQNRISDFFYEHVSHFTEPSFRALFEGAGFEVISIESRYGDEVITLAARPTKSRVAGRQKSLDFQASSRKFHENVSRQLITARETIAEWQRDQKKIALWGAAGKAAALINMLGFTKDKFPIVVDSDPKKAGHFVPGMGQEIQSPAYLKKNRVDGILICTTWRARDIELEIKTKHGLAVPLYVQGEEKIVELTPDLKL